MRICSIILTIIVIAFTQCNQTGSTNYLQVDLKDTTLSQQIVKLTQKIEEEPSNDEYFYLRSNEWIRANRLNYALQDISTALSLKEDNAVYNFKKAELLMEKDSVDVQEAQKLYQRAIELEPSFEDAHFKLGKLYVARQEYENALASFDKLIEIDLNNARAYFWKGIAYKENKFIDQAEAMFFKTTEMDNTYYDAYMQLGEIYTNKNNRATAIQFYDNALRIKPNSDEALYAKGRIYQDSKRYKDAYAAYSQAVLINPGHKFASYGKAFVDVRFENYEEALKTLDQIIRLSEDYSNAYTLRGFVYEMQNQKDKAVADYQTAISLNPQDSIAKQSLKLLQ